MKKTLFALLLAGATVAGLAENVTVKPQGAYATIDTSRATQTMRALADPAQRPAIVDAVQAHPENYEPPVLFALSQALFADGKKDEGAFWFYAGQLRARFDANRCADESARSAVGVLNNNYGPPVNQYMFKDLAKLEALIPKVVEWDRKTPHNYDPRWINLHGMNAMLSGMDGGKSDETMSLPASEWDAIAEKTRKDYLSGFQEAMVKFKAQRQ